jgi:hypothetical protein
MHPSYRWVPSRSVPWGKGRRTSLSGRRRWTALPCMGSLNNTSAESGLMLMRRHRGQEGRRRRSIAQWLLGISRILLFYYFLTKNCYGFDTLCVLQHQSVAYLFGGGTSEGRRHAGDLAVVIRCCTRLKRGRCQVGHGAVRVSHAD